MLQSVTVTNFKGKSLRMELTNPYKNGLLVYNVDGIGGATANVNTTDYASGDGAWFNSSRVQTRNIVLYLAYIDSIGKSVEELRHTVYTFFPIKKPITLTFETDIRTSTITGYVESIESPVFSSQEYSQISILCPDPYFYAVDPVIKSFSGVKAEFEFPFFDDSVEEGNQLDGTLEFSSLQTLTNIDLVYNGDADSGIVINLEAMSEVGDITIFNDMTGEKFVISSDKINKITGAPFGDKDSIIISTKRNDKYIRLFRHGSYTNIIGAIDKDSDWFQVTNGDNMFSFNVAEEEKHNLIVTFECNEAYMGV